MESKYAIWRVGRQRGTTPTRGDCAMDFRPTVGVSGHPDSGRFVPFWAGNVAARQLGRPL